MSWLGSIWHGAQALGSMASNIGSNLGSVQSAVKDAIHTGANVVGDVGRTINDNAGALDSVGLGGVARYAGAGLTSGSQLGHSVANLVGSQSLVDAIRNGVDVYKKGLTFAGDVGNTGQITASPLTKN